MEQTLNVERSNEKSKEYPSSYLVRTQVAIQLIHETLAKVHDLPAYQSKI